MQRAAMSDHNSAVILSSCHLVTLSPKRQAISIPRILFWLTEAAALSLIALVFLAPLLDNGTDGDGWQQLIALFARDGAVRRTASASALGLAVTAFIFFSSKAEPMPVEPTSRTPRTV